jgi:hypothetical protein
LQKLIVLNIIESGVVDKLVSQGHLQVEGGRHNVSALILAFTVANPNGAAPRSNVVGAMETSDGGAIIRDSNRRESVANARRAKLEKTIEREFRPEWANSIGGPINELSEIFSLLKTGNQPVVVRPPVGREAVLELYGELKKLDPKFNPKAMLSSDLANLPGLVNYMATHAIISPYSFDLRKCNDNACCGAICTPANVRDVVMQRQPAP